MKDDLTNFGTVDLKGVAETPAEATSGTIDLRDACSIEAYPQMLRIVFQTDADFTGTVTATLVGGDVDDAEEMEDLGVSFILKDMKAMVPVVKPFMLEHPKFLAVKYSTEVTTKIFAGLEFGA